MKKTLKISLIGIIGAGKTELAMQLAEILKLKLYKEPVDSNPFLVRYYKNPEKFSFIMEMFLLLERKEGIKEDIEIIDRSYEEDIMFSYVLHKTGKMTDEEYKLNKMYFDEFRKTIPEPEIYIYLKCSTDKAMERIKKRGRESEEGVPREFIDNLNDAYKWFFNNIVDEKKVITIDWEEIKDVNHVIEKIENF